jgi:hypothetical protein
VKSSDKTWRTFFCRERGTITNTSHQLCLQASKKAKPAKKKLDKAATNFLGDSFEEPAKKKPAAPKPKPAAEKPKPAAEKPKPKPAKKKEPWESSDDDDDDKFGGGAKSDSDSDFGVPKKPAPAKAAPPKAEDSDSDNGMSWKPSKALKSSNGHDSGDDFDALLGRGDDDSGKAKKPAAKKASGEKKRAAPAAGIRDLE